MPTPARIVLAVVLLALAAYLFNRAMNGGGPLFYFLSAVCIGMAIASFQRGGSGGSSGAGGASQTGSEKGGRGR